MRLVQRFSTGAEEWKCPECGRRFIILLEPAFQKVVLETGNDRAIHSGGSGDLSVAASQPPAALEEINPDESALDPWMRWMDEVNFGSLWDEKGPSDKDDLSQVE